MFCLLEPTHFQAYALDRVRELLATVLSTEDILSIDGKQLCSSASDQFKAVHMLNVLSHQHGTEASPYLIPAEALLNVIKEILVSGYKVKGVVVDAEFTSKIMLRSFHRFQKVSIGCFRSNTEVSYFNQTLKAKGLAK